MTPQPATGGVLGHRCTCGHPDLWHADDARAATRGRCGSAGCPCIAASWPTPPTAVHPAYDSTTGDRITHVIPPGTSEYGLRSCGCDSCRDYYQALPVVELGDEPADLFGEAP